MSAKNNFANDMIKDLSSHQNEFVQKFFNPACKRIFRLDASSGTGKSTTLTAIVIEYFTKSHTARILIIAPIKPLLLQFEQRLRGSNIPVIQVDRFKFREMLIDGDGKVDWLPGNVFLLTAELAKQPDVLNSLNSVSWDLTVLDEANSYKGLRAEAVSKIISSSKRVVLSARSAPELSFSLPEQETESVKWELNKIVDYNGKPAFKLLAPILVNYSYVYNSDELALQDKIFEICKYLEVNKLLHELHRQALVVRPVSFFMYSRIFHGLYFC